MAIVFSNTISVPLLLSLQVSELCPGHRMLLQVLAPVSLVMMVMVQVSSPACTRVIIGGETYQVYTAE